VVLVERLLPRAEPRYEATGRQGEQVRESRMCKALHKAGWFIEGDPRRSLNHTARGTISADAVVQGVDDQSLLTVVHDGTIRAYMDFTGKGNSLNA